MPRNLVVVVADTLRHFGTLPAGAEGAMPYLSAMVRSATVLDRAVASSSWTPPSHVSLLSGIDPWDAHFHLVRSVAEVPSATSLADLWRRSGGESAAFSANFLVAPGLGTAPGYDAYNPGLSTRLAGFWLQALQLAGFEQLLFQRMNGALRPRATTASQSVARVVQTGGLAMHRAILPLYAGDRLQAALDRYLRGTNARTPLHLFVNLMEAHEPYFPPRFPSGPRPQPGYLPTVSFARHSEYLARSASGPRVLDAYVDALRRLDRRWAGVVGVLQRHGVLDDADVLFVSDHGQALGEHGFFGHGFYLHDELVRIPAYLWEFRGGVPVRAPPVDLDWVDHRHLYDLLASRIRGGGDSDVATTLSESLGRRGPALSYWEGPTPRPPGGFLRAAPRSAFNRTVRVLSGSGGAILNESAATGGPEGVDGFAPNAPALEEVAHRVLAAGRGAPGPGALPAEVVPEIDGRLRSWGYD